MSDNDSERKCFTFIWKLENVCFCWHNKLTFIDSPPFKVDELEETEWKLRLYEVFGGEKGCIGFWLNRAADSKGVGSIKIDYELAFLASDGSVLQSLKEVEKTFGQDGYCGKRDFITRNEVFFARRSEFLPQGTITARCRIWKTGGNFSQIIQYLSRTHIVVEKRSFRWNIKNFSTLASGDIQSYESKSLDTDELLLRFELFVTRGQISEEKVRFSVIPNYECIKTCLFQLFLVNSSNNVEECYQDELWCGDTFKTKEFNLFLSKRKLMEEKTAYLPNDILSLQCEFSFSSGVVQQEINENISDCPSEEIKKPDDCQMLKEKDLTVPERILIDNMKSMLNDSSLSDVKLKTKSQTYPAHKSILGARSPVFRAMFSNDMKEKIKECVDIEDLSDDAVARLLRFIYTAAVEELEWGSAVELYEAADKYEILNLKDLCASYLRNYICPQNACEALLLADLHQDEELKCFVQDFILRHGNVVMNSGEWEQLMETNLKLAAETMRRKYKE